MTPTTVALLLVLAIMLDICNLKDACNLKAEVVSGKADQRARQGRPPRVVRLIRRAGGDAIN